MTEPLNLEDLRSIFYDYYEEPNVIQFEACLGGRVNPDSVQRSISNNYSKLLRLSGKVNLQEMVFEPGRLKLVPEIETCENLNKSRDEFFSRYIDPKKFLCSIKTVRLDDHDHVFFAMHHSSGDGLSGMKAFSDLLVNCDVLEDRNVILTCPESQKSTLPINESSQIRIQKFSRFLRLPCANQVEPGYSFRCLDLEKNTIKKSATRLDLTVNEFLLVAICSTIRDFVGKEATRPLSVSVPYRPFKNELRLGNNSLISRLVVKNLYKLDDSQIARIVKDFSEKLKHQSKLVNQRRANKLTKAVFRTERLIYGAAKTFLVDTTLLTNLTALDPKIFFINVPVRNIYFSTPTRIPRNVTFGAAGFNDVIGLTIRYRRGAFDDLMRNNFEKLLINKLDKL